MLVTSFREKVVTRKDSDFRGTPTLLSFSKNGKVLCVAGRCGLLCTLNIEDNTVDDSIIENGGGDWGESFRNSFGRIFL